MKTLPNLTSLRFFLAFLVVIFHIPMFCFNQKIPFFNGFAIFHKGSEAVYVFFSLSGFLIIRQLYLEKYETNTILLKQFFIRRILRIWPLYYLVLVFGFIYYLYILPAFGYNFQSNYNFTNALLLAVFFLPNVLEKLFHPGGIIEVLWSIGIEEQFYIFIAPIIFFIPVKKIVTFLVIFTFAYFVLFYSSYFLFLKKFSMYFFYFSCSGLFGVLLLQYPFLNKIMKLRFLIFFIFIIYFTTSFFSKNFNLIIYHLFSMILFSVLICALIQKPIAILQTKFFIYLGKISYGIYMFHVIVIQVAGLIYFKIISKLNFPSLFSVLYFNIFVISVSILIAHLSYQYYENYFLKLKSNFRIDSKKYLK